MLPLSPNTMLPLPPLLLVLLLSALPPSSISLTPLTQIKATPVELSAFAATVVGLVEKLRVERELRHPTAPVVHIVGASDVEDAVNWAPVCALGATVVLVGPKIVPREARACVTVVRGLYSRALVAGKLSRALGWAGGAEPDVVVLLNADVYTCPWRRTLVDLLQSGIPFVVTMYCEFEGHQLDRMLRWSDIEFGEGRMRQWDEVVKHIYGTDLTDAHAPSVPSVGVGAVPEARYLWEFEANPHAHSPPKDCYGGTQHGVRNSYWLALTGARTGTKARGGGFGKEEL